MEELYFITHLLFSDDGIEWCKRGVDASSQQTKHTVDITTHTRDHTCSRSILGWGVHTTRVYLGMQEKWPSLQLSLLRVCL